MAHSLRYRHSLTQHPPTFLCGKNHEASYLHPGGVWNRGDGSSPGLGSSLPPRTFLSRLLRPLLQFELQLLPHARRRLGGPGQLRQCHRHLHPGHCKRSQFARAYAQRGSVWYEKSEYDKAIADDTQAIAIIPNYAVAYNNRSAAWDEKEEFDRAIADDNQALAIDPSYADALISRSAIWFNKGDYDKAIADDNQALAINPSCAQAYGNRDSAWNMKGDYEKAKADFYQAIAIDANNAEYYNDLAFFQATCLDQALPRRPAGPLKTRARPTS